MAGSGDTPVYLYVKDGALNTTHTGSTEWKSADTTDRVINDTAVLTLDGATALAAAVVGLIAHLAPVLVEFAALVLLLQFFVPAY